MILQMESTYKILDLETPYAIPTFWNGFSPTVSTMLHSLCKPFPFTPLDSIKIERAQSHCTAWDCKTGG